MCGWIGTVSSIIMCLRRLVVQDLLFDNAIAVDTPPFSLAFLRVAYSETIFLTVLLGSNLSANRNNGVFSNLDDFKKQLVKTILGTLTFLFLATTSFYVVEGLGDPPLLRSAFRTGEWIGEWHIFSAMYWSVVTMTTVGFGDMYPTTQYGECVLKSVLKMMFWNCTIKIFLHVKILQYISKLMVALFFFLFFSDFF